MDNTVDFHVAPETIKLTPQQHALHMTRMYLNGALNYLTGQIKPEDSGTQMTKDQLALFTIVQALGHLTDYLEQVNKE